MIESLFPLANERLKLSFDASLANNAIPKSKCWQTWDVIGNKLHELSDGMKFLDAKYFELEWV